MTDPIKPDYYQFPNGLQAADIAEHLSGNGSQIVGYVARSTRIDGKTKGQSKEARIQDLEKAGHLLEREKERIRNEEQ